MKYQLKMHKNVFYCFSDEMRLKMKISKSFLGFHNYDNFENQVCDDISNT